MQAIDILQVTRNKMVKKRFPQGRGVGGEWILGEETGNKRDSGPGTRDRECANWSWNDDHLSLTFAAASIVRAEGEIICKHLRCGRRRLRASGFVVSRDPKCEGPGAPA